MDVKAHNTHPDSVRTHSTHKVTAPNWQSEKMLLFWVVGALTAGKRGDICLTVPKTAALNKMSVHFTDLPVILVGFFYWLNIADYLGDTI